MPVRAVGLELARGTFCLERSAPCRKALRDESCCTTCCTGPIGVEYEQGSRRWHDVAFLDARFEHDASTAGCQRQTSQNGHKHTSELRLAGHLAPGGEGNQRSCAQGSNGGHRRKAGIARDADAS